MRWMRCHNYQVDQGILSHERRVATPDELILMIKKDITKTICMFIMEVKDGSGKDYNRDTLYDLIVMVQAFFKENRRPFKFFDDNAFFDLKNTLDNRMRDLSKQGKIAPRLKAEPITGNEEEKMWNEGILGDDSSQQLVDTILYLLGVHFGLRAADEHKSLKVDCQFKVMYDESVGLKYISYCEMTSKCNQGGISERNVPPKKGCAYQNVNSDRCVVRLFEKYMSHRPSHDPKCAKDFYLRPLAVSNGDIWYSYQACGIHTLQKVVKKMCVKAGISGRRTNHSWRATSATCLYEQRHRSVAVRSYKRTSSEQMRKVTDMLYGNHVGKTPKVKATSTVSTPPPEKSDSAKPIVGGSISV